MTAQYYEIRVRGLLDSSWSEWFGGMSIAHDPTVCDTILFGPVPDETALYSLLIKARNLSLTLVSVSLVEPPHSATEEQPSANCTSS